MPIRPGLTPNPAKSSLDRKYKVVQVCETLESPETREREVSSLRMAMRERKLRQATIVTRNEQDDLVVDEGLIHVVPVWDFLLA